MTAAAKDITAEIQYLANDRDLAVYIASVAGGEVQSHEGNYIMQPVTVHDGRSKPRECSLDREGFLFVESASEVTDYYDDEVVQAVYYPEIIALVQKSTGAARVEIFDHTRRATSDAVRKQKIVREPANIIHNDYTASPVSVDSKITWMPIPNLIAACYIVISPLSMSGAPSPAVSKTIPWPCVTRIPWSPPTWCL